MHAIAKVKKTPSDIQVMPLTVDLLNLVMVIPYSFIIWFMTMFINVFSFAGYAMTIIHIDINVLLEFVKYFPAFFYDCIMSLLKNQEYLQLFLPCSQFLLTCMFVPYYREQAIFLLSCGYFYGNTEQMLKMPQKAQTFLAANKLLEKIGLNKKWATKAQVSNSARNAVANPNANQERLRSGRLQILA
uniref:Transmembrane protein n=1 Tax=Steinernema glaseri TaxID=37863 RepID=A0A1I7YN14_9BILA